MTKQEKSSRKRMNDRQPRWFKQRSWTSKTFEDKVYGKQQKSLNLEEEGLKSVIESEVKGAPTNEA